MRYNIGGPLGVAAGAAIAVPASVREVIVLGDGDSEEFLTHKALLRAAQRWTRPGITIRLCMAPQGADFNDILRRVA